MKKSNFLIIIFLMLFFIHTNFDFAQDLTHCSWGISAVVNNSQADLLFPIWIGNLNTLAPSIGIVNIGDINTDISAGLVFHHYIRYNDNFSPIIGLRVGGIFESPKTGPGTSDFILGALGGGEYFFSCNFSIGIEAQLNLTFSDKLSSRFGNPGGTTFNTGSVIYATVYF